MATQVMVKLTVAEFDNLREAVKYAKGQARIAWEAAKTKGKEGNARTLYLLEVKFDELLKGPLS